MKLKTFRILSLLLSLVLVAQAVCPLAGNIFGLNVVSAATAQPFSDKELDTLLGPIALYPDPLLAQVIPAATFVDQITLAYKTLKGSTNEKLIENQPWDVSVKSVSHYPQVLEMMASQTDWTTAVGQAYVNQSTDVMKSIQRLRALAKGSGALVSTSQTNGQERKRVHHDWSGTTTSDLCAGLATCKGKSPQTTLYERLT